MAHDFLIEIGTEEIPARFLKSLVSDFKKQLENELKTARLTHGVINEYATPRRIALQVKALADKQADLNQELKGPKLSIAYDAKGELTPAGLGFAKKNNIDPKKLQKKIVGNDEILFFERHEKGQATKTVLGNVVAEALKKMYLPVAMRWGSEKTQFYRPVQWILALLDDAVLKFSFAGQNSGDESYGHRFLHPKAIKVKNADSYETSLEKAFVMVSVEKRKEKISGELKAAGLKQINEALLDEVTCLTEYPTVVKSSFDTKYLEVPKECLITTMQKNQKYFPIETLEGLTHEFLIAADGVTDKNIENIKMGNAKVVTARLEDARFYYFEDRKVKLENFNELLKNVVFQEKLGTVYQKVERIQKIVGILAEALHVTGLELTDSLRAAQLCKADLASKMVYEFPNLQGIMGEKYAQSQGEKNTVPKAIFEHYLPRFAGDELPTTVAGALTAMADKLDTLCGCYFAGLIPTSSQDPYALRRGAQGVVQILLKFEYELPLKNILEKILSLFGTFDKALPQTIYEFVYQRLRQSLKEQAVDYDILDAVFAVNHESFLTTAALCKLFQSHRKENWFVPLVDTAVRVNNILDPKVNVEIDESLFVLKEEKNVYSKLGQPIKVKQQESVINGLKDLVQPVGEFFEKVLVNDKDEKIKKNRMALVKKVSDFYRQVAAFEKIVVTEKTKQ